MFFFPKYVTLFFSSRSLEIKKNIEELNLIQASLRGGCEIFSNIFWIRVEGSVYFNIK